MTPRFLLCQMALLLGMVSVIAAESNAFDQANRQFKNGDYAAAAACYEKILADNGPSAAALYNLGNTYQRLGQYGPAILSYERAKLLAPRNPDLLANLALARKAVAAFDETGHHPGLDAVLNYLSRNEWSWLAALSALWLGALALLAGALHRSRRWMGQLAMASAGIATLTLVASGMALYLRRAEANRGIVLSERATVRLSPFDKAESLGTPGPGRIVHIHHKSGAFLFIDVPGVTLRGWMSNKDVAAISPLP